MTSASRCAYDDVIITAANASQAKGYRAELGSRRDGARLPAGTEFHVIPDPHDRRVGSGAATLAALAVLARQHRTSLKRLVANRRILILHSGGDSRRLPAYAAHGKLFLPLPRWDDRGRNLSLFDLLLHDLSTPSLGDEGRVVIAAGDLYLALERQSLTLHGEDFVGVAFRGAAETGTRHGVYVAKPDGNITTFLQKPTLDEAAAAGAIDPEGFVLVDTGVVSLSPRAVTAIDGAARSGLLSHALRPGSAPLDLYEHLLIGVLANQTPERYAESLAKDQTHQRALLAFRSRLPKLSSRVETAANCRFLHIGTTRELLDRLGPGFGDASASSRNVCFNSHITAPLRARGASIVEGCSLSKPTSLAGDNVLVGVPPEFDAPISLPRGVGLTVLPIDRADWAVIAFGDRDDFKSRFSSGGTFLNRPVNDPAAAERSLWDADIWFVGSLAKSYARARSLIRGEFSQARGHRSMAWLMAHVNHDRLIAARARTERRGRLASICDRMLRHDWLATSDVLECAATPAEALDAAKRLDAAATDLPATTRARFLHASSRFFSIASKRRDAELTGERAFESVRQSVHTAVPDLEFPSHAAIVRDQVVWATCPARVDLAGGWSDTPPICTDRGGSVVNAAITINGQYPLQAICRLTDSPTIRLNSIDLGRSITYRTAEPLRVVGNPHDWAALPKAALLLTGFVPKRGASLAKHLSRFGGGLDITVFSALPKGSGMGSSSILGAVLLAALLRVLGQSHSTQRVIELTSVLEQFMSTGGGWQDQAGGAVPGVKLLTTAAGPRQVPSFDVVPGHGALGGSEAAARCMLFFTGQRRLAKNILRNVVARYLEREPAVRTTIEELKHGAEAMSHALRHGTLDEVASHLADYWKLKRRLDEGSTNPRIEALFDSIARDTSGHSLLGAGGGGFAFLIAKDAKAATRIRATLSKSSTSPLARFYDFAIDHQGLNVSTL